MITVEDIVLSEEFVNHVDKKSYLTEKGRLTASNFGSVLNCKRVTQSLIKRVLGQYDLSRV